MIVGVHIIILYASERDMGVHIIILYASERDKCTLFAYEV